MRVWRFHRRTYHPLDTTGSYIHGGRWSPPGIPVIYASQTYAGGLLELLAHISTPRRPPRDHIATQLMIPDEAGVVTLVPPSPGWDHPYDYRIAQSLAEPWLNEGEDLGLIVPSVPAAPIESNVVVNARHSLFGEVEVVDRVEPDFDHRVWG